MFAHCAWDAGSARLRLLNQRVIPHDCNVLVHRALRWNENATAVDDVVDEAL